ncbi:uncharacterized protein KY384_006152 [Bacidia gigantensis]|uniref:uncharacterized protein n=1 Tax=Bacidia gigantensis TaxID=2732470 RepID=UPI001D03BFC6|nr:uncharacterized protein KY384_006152 [Bacidia gigantensis]KAG8529515.1 hypothetical protein KY384_006152 [Bacidia gigantensis]
MLNGKIYVVTSIDLVNAVNRNSKVLAFNPFIAQLGKRITGHNDATSRVVQHNLNGEDGPGYVTEIHDSTVTSLAPGINLESMTAEMLLQASVQFDKLDPGGEVDLFAWIKHMVTLEFNQDLNTLIVDILPTVFAPKGHQARRKLGLAFQRYFEKYDAKHAKGAALIQSRHSLNTRYGLDAWNSSRLEVGVLLGILANTVPAIFYMIVHVLSNPNLLRDIRMELDMIAVSLGGDRTRCLNILTMRERCTLLHSTLQEVLRLHALGSSVRYVREDIVLQDQYLLKKGMIVQMPMAVTHLDPQIWGSDAESFQPRRFLKLPKSKEFKTNTTAYRPFGGGASLCPGRHFVTLEAMALTALFVLRYDVVPVDGPWEIPRQKQESMATNIFPPEKDVRVMVKRRKGYEHVVWDFTME